MGMPCNGGGPAVGGCFVMGGALRWEVPGSWGCPAAGFFSVMVGARQ